MAPRSQGVQRETAHGAGDGSGRVRNAYTGAGVNARRETIAGSRGDSHSQKARRTHGAVPRPQDGRAAMPRPQNGRTSRLQGSARSGNYDESRGLLFGGLAAPRMGSGVVDDEMSADRTASPITTFTAPRAATTASPSTHLPPFSGSKLTRIFPESQRRLDPIAPAGRNCSFTISPNPIRMLNTPSPPNSNPTPTPTAFLSSQTYPPLLSAPKSRAPYRGSDPIKTLVSNTKLRAILADKPYPKERKKSGGERPVLKMGMSKEYK